MNEVTGQLGVWMALVAIALGIVLTIAWIVLPFAIIGTKPLLKELLAEMRKTNAMLSDVLAKR
jgi:hypothetical protein